MDFFEGLGFVSIVLWVLKGLVKILWVAFFVFPTWMIRKTVTGIISLFHKGFYVSAIAIILVLVLGSLSGIADISTGGQADSIVKHDSFSYSDTTGALDGIYFSDDSFGYKYCKRMTWLLRIPVFTTQFSSPIVGRIGAGLFASAKDSISDDYSELFLALLFAYMGITLYFLVYDILFGFIVIVICVIVDVIIHAVRR